MLATVDVRFHAPPPGDPLHPYVLAIFRVRSATAGWTETILPKGNVDLLFNLGGPILGTGFENGDHLVRPGESWTSGLKTRPYRIRPMPGMYIVGVSLRADAAAALLPESPAALLNREAPGPADYGEAAERLHGTDDFGAQCALLRGWLLARTRPRRGAEVARHACALLRRARADDPVHGAARALAVSTRHLRRIVTEQVGVGPAEYVRLSRFTEALVGLHVPGATIGRVAHEAGYYDHAHFCRDFRRFAGLTPQEYRGVAPHPTPGHIIT